MCTHVDAAQVNLLPVEQEGQVVGVLTRHDVLRGIYASKSPFL
jgi:CBS domain-containing protein